jgi:hypothetical protein
MQYGGGWYAGGRVQKQLEFYFRKHMLAVPKAKGWKLTTEMYKELVKAKPDNYASLWIFREGRHSDRKRSRYIQLVQWTGSAKPIPRKGEKGKKYYYVPPAELFDREPPRPIIGRLINAQTQGNRGGVLPRTGTGLNAFLTAEQIDNLRQTIQWRPVVAEAPAPAAPEQPRPTFDELTQERERERFWLDNDQP